MAEFDPTLPGNKGIPAPQEGYEQRKVSFRGCSRAKLKGWEARKMNGQQVCGADWVLCERKIEHELSVVSEPILDTEELQQGADTITIPGIEGIVAVAYEDQSPKSLEQKQIASIPPKKKAAPKKK